MSITVFCCVSIIVFGIASLSQADPVTTYIGENISTNNLSAAGTLDVTGAADFDGTATFSSATYSALFTGGNVGIGVATPTAVLHLKAGTETASTAPLKFTSGVNLTTPEAGAMEYNGTNLFITNASATRKTIAFTDSNITGNAANVTGTVAVANGGTGATTLTGVLKGDGTNAISAMTGTTGYTARWTDANTLGTGVLYDDGTNVGIGTVSPTYNLSIEGAGGTDAKTILSVKQMDDGSGHAGGQISLVSFDWGEWALSAGDPNLLSNYILYGAGGYTSLSSYSSGIDFVDQNKSSVMRILDGGNVGIGVAAPTASLHLKAGTATAETAPLKFTSGVNLTTPEAGAMEYDGTNLFITNSSATRKTLAYLDSNITGTATNVTGIVAAANGGTGTNNGSITGTGELVFAAGTDQNIMLNPSGAGSVYIDGMLGIGTDDPSTYLHVEYNGSSNATGFQLTNIGTSGASSAGAFANLYEDDGAAVASGHRLGGFMIGGARDASHTLANSTAILAYAGEDWSSTATGSYLSFQTTANGGISRSEKMRLDGSGRLGIGSISPLAKLEVNDPKNYAYPTIGTTTGAIHLTGSATNDYSSALTFGATNNTAQAGIYVQASGDYGTNMYFGTSDNYATGSQARMTIDHHGRVGIGTIDPSALLTIKATSAYDTAPLGSELMDGNPDNWDLTGWTGDFATGFTHDTGNTSPLSRTLTTTANQFYQISFTASGVSAGSFTVALGGNTYSSSIDTNGSYSYGLRILTGSGPLIFTPTLSFNGMISAISVKQVTDGTAPATEIVNSSGSNVFEIRSSSSATNSFLGVNAGSYNLSGIDNTALGSSAFRRNISGSYNTAVGYQSMYYNTAGHYNTAVGMYTLQSNNSGHYNTALGYNALNDNTIGDDNVAVGMNSLETNTTGYGNTGVGVRSLDVNLTGNENTAMGNRALRYNSVGSENTALGYETLYNATGSYNTAVGRYALWDLVGDTDNAEGISNTAIGRNTGRGITTGSYNTILGADVTGLAADLSNTIILADGEGTIRTYIDDNGNVGIGTTTPQSKLDVRVSSTSPVLSLTQSGAGEIITLTNTASATAAAFTLTNLGSGNSLVVNDEAADTTPFVIDASGRVGIGTTTPNASAAVEISSTTGGFLPPRTTPGAISSPATGLIIYNTATDKLNFYNGSAWEEVTSAVP